MSVPYKLIGIGVVLLALIGIHEFLVIRATNNVKAEIEAEYKEQLVDAERASLQKEKALRDSQIEAMKKKDEAIKNIDNKLSAVSGSLYYYKKCSTDNSYITRSGKACPGRELSREDAEFLAREAAKADKVVKERDFYYERYEEARKALAAR